MNYCSMFFCGIQQDDPYILFASKTYREVKNNSASSNDSCITFKASTVENPITCRGLIPMGPPTIHKDENTKIYFLCE
jgi:hypothetical protein